MSVQTEVDRIKANVANTYSVLESAGAEMPEEQTSDNLPDTAASISAVLYGKAQTLTEAQKTQARENIGIVGTGKDGEDYVLTPADKAEIAEMVDGATVVQAPLYVDSVGKMTDTSRVYVLTETGHIWAYMDATVEQEVTVRDDIIGTTDNPYQTGRLSSGGALSNDVSTHTLTPYIDLTKAEYQGKTIQIHLEGNRYASEGLETYIMSAFYDASKNVILARGYTTLVSGSAFDPSCIEINGTTSAIITLSIPHTYLEKTVGYIRFCGLGTVTDSVYITYQDMQTVTDGQWVDTGTTYAPTLTEEDKAAMVEEIAAMVDTHLLNMLGDGTVTV